MVIAERYKFWGRAQHARESYHEYAAELRKLTRFCEFGSTLEDTLRDRFVCGIRDSVVCKKLLTIDALMLDVALKTAAAQEAVDREAAGLASGAGHIHALTQLKNTKPKPGATGNARRENSDCYRCGGTDHNPSKCNTTVTKALTRPSPRTIKSTQECTMHGRSGCLVLLYISLEASPLRYASTQVSLFVDTSIKFGEE